MLYSGEFKPIFKKVARTLYLSLRVLPKSLREPMGLAYLLARAADTIADTELVGVDERQQCLARLKSRLSEPGTDPDEWRLLPWGGAADLPEEGMLLQVMDQLLVGYWGLDPADRGDVKAVLGDLIFGMEQDLKRTSLADLQELDIYCHYAAGVVGVFWSRMLARHEPRLAGLDWVQMEQWGDEFGKGLQLINVIKDIAKDHRHGRCYLPEAELRRLGLTPQDLGDSEKLTTLRPLIDYLIAQSLQALASGQSYILQLPRTGYFIRLAALWPLWIGLATLEFLARDELLFDPKTPHKIPRRQLRQLLAKSFVCVGADRLLTRYFERAADRLKNSPIESRAKAK